MCVCVCVSARARFRAPFTVGSKYLPTNLKGILVPCNLLVTCSVWFGVLAESHLLSL